MSIKKLVIFIVVGLLFIGGITLAAWEEGRVGLFSGFGLKGYKRREADGLMVASKGKKPDFKEAFRLYQIDAEKGDGVALRKIGEMYRDGRGVPQSDVKARESWIKAAAPGDVETLLWLADKYYSGDGRALQVSNPEVVRLLRRAASQGNAVAQAKLAHKLYEYAKAYQMKPDLDEVLSARQKEELASLPKVAELLKAHYDKSLYKMTSGEIEGRIAEVKAELGDAIREKFNWEAYFWYTLAAASKDDAELVAQRDGLAELINQKDKKVVERVQNLISKWSESDAPGDVESPFVKDEGPVIESPGASKQTLSAILAEISANAAKQPESRPEPAKPAAAKLAPSAADTATAATPALAATQKPASVSSVIASMPVPAAAAAMDPEPTKKYVRSMYAAQIGMAVRRNVLIAGPQNRVNGQLNYSWLASNYQLASVEVARGSERISDLRKNAKSVHPSALAYSDRLERLLRGRLLYINRLRAACQAASENAALSTVAMQAMDEFSSYEQREIGMLDSLEATMIKQLGDELSFAVPERSALYASMQALHAKQVIDKLNGLADNVLYNNYLVGMKLDFWTFELGEFRQGARGNPTILDGAVVSVPLNVAVVGRQSGRQRNFTLNLYFTVDYMGRLILIGASQG
jgi:TPR repeat protein